MRFSSLIILLASGVILLYSCLNTKEGYTDLVVNMLKEENDISSYSHIVIIPELGCGGCISEAENFFRENKNENIYFIFTKISSMKEIRLRLGKMIEQKNVLIDEQGLYASKKEEMNVYPIIIDIRNPNVKTWCFLEPGVSYKSLLILPTVN